MKYFLDTNIISYILNGNEKVKNRIEEILLNNDIISIPVFSYYEIKRGLLSVGASAKIERFNNFVRICELVDINISTFDIAAQIYAQLKQKGNLIEDADLFIGVSALENNAVLITNNANHLQRIPNLKIEVLN
ncbi:MAG: type II toxin-antitoxin system VapC family toxin [Treponemataceae bacterium]|jgi:predicted nucleic acid-binding protein|nr:type II toxin-antitoxin system VapC family toxin [Treponemataceae bacterium]